MAYLAKEQEGQALAAALRVGGSQCGSAPCLQSCLGNSEGNYSSCSETANVDLLCRFSFMLGSKHRAWREEEKLALVAA